MEAIEAVERGHMYRLLTAGAGAGVDVRVQDLGRTPGEAFAAAARHLPGATFNTGNGLRDAALLERARRFWQAEGTVGWVQSVVPPWPGAVPVDQLAMLRREAAAPPEAGVPSGISIRLVARGGAPDWAGAYLAASPMPDAIAAAWRTAVIAMHDVDPGLHLVLATEGDEAVGAARLTIDGDTALLAAAAVRPSHRGRGLQRALIAFRMSEAVARGVVRLAATATPGGTSERNLAAMGFERVALRGRYASHPGASAAP